MAPDDRRFFPSENEQNRYQPGQPTVGNKALGDPQPDLTSNIQLVLPCAALPSPGLTPWIPNSVPGGMF